MKFAFFGTPDLAVTVLNILESHGFVPSLVITNPDTPQGRHQTITPPPTKVWALERDLPVLQPTTLKDPDQLSTITSTEWDVFVVFAYGKIIPEWLLSRPQYGTINLHPSLLPKLRGASPIRSTLLTDLDACGVSIISMDKEMDHGPLLAQVPYTLTEPIPGRKLDDILCDLGGRTLASVLTTLSEHLKTATEQDHEAATFCTKITKDMAEIHLDPRQLPTGNVARSLYQKICAFDGWPETFFIDPTGRRVKIKSASLDRDALSIHRVTPEGKNEMEFSQYLASLGATT